MSTARAATRPDRLADTWLDLASDILARPLTRWPDEPVADLLVSTFGAGGCTFNLARRPTVSIVRMWPPAYFAPYEAEIREYARRDAPTRHPLLRYYRATGDTSPLAVSAVPDRFTGADVLADWRELGRRWGGAQDQLAIPLALGPWGNRAFVLDRDALFGVAEVGSAGRIQRLLAGVDRQVSAFAQVDGRTSETDADGTIRLTPRERVVLDLLARGLTAAAIGRRLAITERTVQKHLQRVYGKLRVADRLGAVQRAQAIGVLRPPVRSSRPTAGPGDRLR